MSICVAVFIFINAVRNLKSALDLFLERAPMSVSVNEIKEHVEHIDGVLNVHHIHIWSMDGESNYATMHVVAEGDHIEIKARIRNELREHGISHATLELESAGEACRDEHCHVDIKESSGHHHHHHHH
jgi:cobalt-zinc-cadmium efflux system protein